MNDFLLEFSYVYLDFVFFACVLFVFIFAFCGWVLLFYDILDFFKKIFRITKGGKNNETSN